MRLFKKLINPLIALIGIQLVWILVLVFWIYWFVGRHRELTDLARRYSQEQIGHGFDWIVLTEGIVLLVVILAGIYVIFLFWQRQATLLKQQKNFISQVTHELKSPLASIQLHLETIRLRNPPPDKLERFVDTMLADADRLNNLITNLLMAGRLEHTQKEAQFPVIDFSQFVRDYMERKRAKLPEGGSITLEIEDGIRAAIDAEGMATAFRNLVENAVLYSTAAPEITVTLKKAGRQCRLTFRDNGRGIDAKDLKKIFNMFYRIRRTGENIRGTGLGLYIVKSIIVEHGGQITASSEGLGKGCAFHISLPAAKGNEAKHA